MIHYNAAHIWGTIHDIENKETENNKKPYLEVQVNCPSSKYGNIRAFCRVWGEQRVNSILKHFSVGDRINARGMVSQYVGRHKVIKTNFTIFDIFFWNPAEDKHKDARSAFILSGECDAFEAATGDTPGRLSIRVVRTDEDETKVLSDETFVVEFPKHMAIDLGGEPAVGSTYRVKGSLQQEEDEFGELTVPSRPVVMGIQEVKESAG